ncbi:MAG: hypothetical protein KC619_01555 [Myxococcales bacterium]|nr:hypothetical protein [Myxococcales bacterium]
MRFLPLLVLVVALPGCGLTLGLDPTPDGGLDAATRDAGVGVACGPVTCAAGLECCNPSCGVCTAPGAGCAAIQCIDAGPGDDAGMRRDAGPPDAGSASCGGIACVAGEECCVGCDGMPFCTAGGCPAMPCPALCTRSAECAATEWCDLDGVGCGGSGTCVPRPTACSDPCPGVCGCDGITYCNACDANVAGVEVERNTPCEFARGCVAMDTHSSGVCGTVVGYAWDGFSCRNIDCTCTGTECGLLYPSLEACQAAFASCACGGLLGLPCGTGDFCDYPIEASCGDGDASGACHPLTTGCTDIYMPVCGCDGMTYENPCEASSRGVAVKAEGICPVVGSP